MNERIQELILECTYFQFPMCKGGTETFDTEKFAELIVRECTEICDEVQRRFGQYTFTARICKEEIKEHFGVEE